MKKRIFSALVLIMAGVIVMAEMTGCDNGTNGDPGNTEPKKLNITGFSGTNIRLGIFPQGTTKDQALAETGVVAGFEGLVAPIITLFTNGDTPFTGTGTFDVFAIIDSTSIYVLRDVSITTAETETPFSSFTSLGSL
jgi:hypothetical protein